MLVIYNELQNDEATKKADSPNATQIKREKMTIIL